MALLDAAFPQTRTKSNIATITNTIQIQMDNREEDEIADIILKCLKYSHYISLLESIWTTMKPKPLFSIMDKLETFYSHL